MAFSTAGIINYIALYSGRTYQIANTNEKFTDGLFILLRIITVLIAIVFSLGFVLVNNYDVYKATIVLLLCILKCIEALGDVFYGILQKQNYLYIAGESLTFKSLFALLAFVVVDIITHNLVLAIAVFLLVNILFLIFFDIQQSKNRCGMNLSLNRLNLIELAQMGIYTFLFTVLIMIIMNLPKYFIDYFLNNADQGIYGILTMPATFIMMLAQFILQPSLLYLTNCKEQKDYQLFDSRVLKICITILSSLIIIIPTAYFLGVPVLQIIYGVSLEGYRLGLILIIIGSAFYAVSNILLNAHVVLDYLFVFLRHAKNKPAAAIMMRHPAIVKIVVPIPPVDGRVEPFLLTTFVTNSLLSSLGANVIFPSSCLPVKLVSTPVRFVPSHVIVVLKNMRRLRFCRANRRRSRRISLLEGMFTSSLLVRSIQHLLLFCGFLFFFH